MAYSAQTFSVGEVLTSSKMNQIEVNIRDHQHGVSSVFDQAATQAEQETGTSVLKYVTSGRQHFHPSAAKGWANFGLTGNLLASYNVSGITDIGPGDAQVDWATDFSGVNYSCVMSIEQGPSTQAQLCVPALLDGQMTAAKVRVGANRVTDAAYTDPINGEYHVVAFGDQ